MISHDRALALISARYDQLLSPEETRAVQEHLATCASCRQFAAETDLLVHGLRSLPQLPPSPRVSRAVRDGLPGGGGTSPWGWLGQGMRIATSPALAVASSFVLIAALAFIIVLALRPLGVDEQPRATISAMVALDEEAASTETPTPAPTVEAPTAAPTAAAVTAPTQAPTPAPTAPRVNVPPATQTPVPTVPPEPTPAATERVIAQAPAPTAPPAETSAPTELPAEPPAPTEPPPATEQAITAAQPAADEVEQVPAAAPTSPPIEQSTDGAPFGSEEEPETAEGSSAPPVVVQPTIGPGGPPAGAQGDDVEPNGAAAGDVAMTTGPAAEPEATTDDTAGAPEAEPAPEPTAPPVEPTSTPVDILAQDQSTSSAAAAPPAAEPAPAPELPERRGNEAVGMDAEDMAASIQATVEAGLADDSGPPTVPVSTTPPQPALAEAEIVAMTPTPEAVIAASGQPAGAEITGGPAAAGLESGSEPDPAGGAGATTETAPIEAAGQAPIEAAVDQAPVAPQALGAPEPAWPGIGGGGTQHVSTAGYSAVADGNGVTVYGPDGTPVGVVGGGIPIWSPWGTSVLVIGSSGQGAVWDAAQGLMPVEPATNAARDVPVGWYGGSPLVQRVYLDGSGLVELRVAPVSGGGYPLWSGTSESVFGAGVTAARLSPDGGQVAFVSGGQLYVAPVTDPGSATPAG